MPACYAKGCRNSSLHGVKMSCFPKDPQRRAVWTNQCKKFKATTSTLPNDSSVLCEYHFTADMWEKPRVDGKRKLKCNAEPTIFGDSVVQMVGIGKQNINYHCPSTITMHTIPHTKDIQILTQSGLHYKIVVANGSSINATKSKITAGISKDLHMNDSEKVSNTAKNYTSLLLNSSATSSCIQDVKLEDSQNSMNADDHISNSNLQADDDSDTDSFIYENFEPISYEEIEVKTENYENFEPIIDDVVDSNKEDNLSTEDKNLKSNIITEELSLQASLKRLDKSASKPGPQCRRCKVLEKVCHKSERVRNMMKKNNKHAYRTLKRKIQSLENKIKVLECNNEGLHKFLNEDQIDFLGKEIKKVYKWSEETLEKANQYRLTFGLDGYKLLLEHNWPLPSLRTLRHKQDEKKRIKKLKLEQTETTMRF